MHTTTQHCTDRAEDFLFRRSRSGTVFTASSSSNRGKTGSRRLEISQRELGSDPASTLWKTERGMLSFPTAISPPQSSGLWCQPGECRHTRSTRRIAAPRGNLPVGAAPLQKTLVKPSRGVGFAHHPTPGGVPGAPAGLCRASERGAPGRVPAVSAARPACVARGNGSGCRRRRGGLGRGPGQGVLSPPPPSSPRRRFP